MRYRYYNRNPKQIKTSDCVCRAISTATGLKYEAVNNLLDIISQDYDCDKLCVCCYNHLLEDVLGYEKNICTNLEHVEDVVKEHPNSILIIRIDAHLTSAIYGTLLDI